MAQLWAHKAGVARSYHGYPSTSMQLQAAGAFAVGDLIVVGLSAGSTQAGMDCTGVRDQLGNIYVRLTNGAEQFDPHSGGGATGAFAGLYASVCTTPGVPLLTATLTRPPEWGACMGVDGFTQINTTVDASATPATGPGTTFAPTSQTTGATTAADELVLACYFDQGSSTSLIAPAGWTAGVAVSDTNDNNMILLYKNSGASGSTFSAANPVAGGNLPGEAWAYVVVVLQQASLVATETMAITEDAAVTVLGGTTPAASEQATMTDLAQVYIIGDTPAPANFDLRRAPSWDAWHRISRYRFLFERLDTPGHVVCTLPLTDVNFTLLINQAGSFRGRLKLSDRRTVPDLDLARAMTTEEKNVVHFERGGQILGHAVILTRSYDVATDTLELGGQDLFAMLGRRVISDDLTYANMDQLSIARALLTYTQAKPQGRLGIISDPSIMSGRLLSRTYLKAQGTAAAGSGTADSGNIATAIQNFANLNGGFEFRVRTAWEGNQIVRRLELGYPRLGSTTAQATPFRWAYPSGGIEKLTWPSDGTQTSRVVYALGNQQTDNTRPVAVSQPVPDFPLTEEVVSYSADDLASLQAFADARQRVRSVPLVVPEITVLGNVHPTLGQYREGEYGRYVVKAGVTGMWPRGLDSVWRIVGLDVTIKADGTEEVKHLVAAA